MLNYDWKDTGSAAYFEREFNGFQFKGEGWYDNGNDTVFIMMNKPKDDFGPAIYDFYCWNERWSVGVRQQLVNLAKAPVHTLYPVSDEKPDGGVEWSELEEV